MIGTSPLIIDRVGLINRSHIRAQPLPSKWPRLRHDGDGVFSPHFPADIDSAGCAGNDHLTFNRVHDWQVTTGEFDPYELYDSILKRATSSNAGIKQSLPTVSLNTTYHVAVTGDCVVAFNSITQTWGDGTTTNSRYFSSTSEQNITFTNGVPTTVSVFFTNNDMYLEQIRFREGGANNPGNDLLNNTSFEQIDTYFYDIESWYEDSKDITSVPTNTLGWLEGFNDSQIYTVFE